jgi:glutathione peroxidase
MAISISDVVVHTSDGKTKSLNDYKGDVLLIVNVASQCGNTPQYTQLEALNRKYMAQGLRVLGFPCNDFGGQEPGTVEEVLAFCSSNYDVTFDIFDKVHAKGPEQSTLYAKLTQVEPTGDVAWNFEKFLVSRDGVVVGRFRHKMKPDDPEIVSAIERELANAIR